MNLLRGLKNDKGKNIEELNILHSLNVDEATGAVNVKLNLTPDYRKVKQLVSDKLEQIDWVKKVNVSMAP